MSLVVAVYLARAATAVRLALFLAALLAPGFALLCWIDRRALRRGLLESASAAIVASLALLTPITGLAYLCHASIEAFAAVIALLAIAGVACAWRRRGGELLRVAARRSMRLEWLAIVVALTAAAPLGSIVTHDQQIHAAKSRALVETGFSLQDPLSPDAVIESRYLVTPQHAIGALASWWLDVPALDAWWHSGAVIRFLVAGALAALAAALRRRRDLGASVALLAVPFFATMRAMPYPNKVAFGVALPWLLIWLLPLLRGGAGRRGAVARVAIAALALASLHVGAQTLAAATLVPLIVAAALRRRRAIGARQTALTIAAIVLPVLAYVVPLTLLPDDSLAQQGAENAFLLRTFGSFGGFTILDPERYSWVGAVLLLSLVAALRRRATRGDRLVAAMVMFATAAMFFPPLFALLSRFMPYWIVMRFAFLIAALGWPHAGGFALDVVHRRLGAIGGFAAPRRARAIQWATLAAFTLASAWYFEPLIGRFWRTRHSADAVFADAATFRGLVARSGLNHPLVAADPDTSLLLAASTDACVLAPPPLHANPADVRLRERAHAQTELLAAATPSARRQTLLREQSIDALLLRDAEVAWFAGLATAVARGDGWTLLRVQPPIPS